LHLRTSPNINFQAIREREDHLRLISEEEIRSKLETHPIFEHINAEKMSPIFLSLANSHRSNASLTCIKNNDGNPFRSDTDREEFIVQFFENIYRLPADHPESFDGCIEDFLGAEICANPIVLNSKLTAEESARLDCHLTLSELDDAIRDCKKHSACGLDGFSNNFFKKILEFFQVSSLHLRQNLFC
jgi:hypothetical protein